jgi:hypothetical protein
MVGQAFCAQSPREIFTGTPYHSWGKTMEKMVLSGVCGVQILRNVPFNQSSRQHLIYSGIRNLSLSNLFQCGYPSFAPASMVTMASDSPLGIKGNPGRK